MQELKRSVGEGSVDGLKVAARDGRRRCAMVDGPAAEKISTWLPGRLSTVHVSDCAARTSSHRGSPDSYLPRAAAKVHGRRRGYHPPWCAGGGNDDVWPPHWGGGVGSGYSLPDSIQPPVVMGPLPS